MKKWVAVGRVGVFWLGDRFVLGHFRYRWVAICAAWLWTQTNTTGIVTIYDAQQQSKGQEDAN